MDSFFFYGLILAYAAGALLAVCGVRGNGGRALLGLCSALGASAGLGLGVRVLATGEAFVFALPELLPVGGGLSLALDGLGAFFLILIGFVGIPAAIYSVGYTRSYEGPSTHAANGSKGAENEAAKEKHVSFRLMSVMFPLFLLCMSLVPMAGNVLTFLLMWEGMSLTSYFLVITESAEKRTLRAGIWYVGMTHVGLAFLMAAFLLCANGGSGSFDEIRKNAAQLPAAVRDLAFVLALVGFGSKAGVVPLHVWLPMAHPAAPSHVSALMSGVMIKLGVFGILRVALDLLGGDPAWWGGVILGVGVVSALMGILYALMEADLKRLLAYSSVENVGIVFIGVGAGLIFAHYGLMPLAMMALVGGLYHSLNHAGFKGLLFLGAGSVLHGTHTRNMEWMGGLIKRMPWTAAFFLLGSAAIAGLPPLNGFVSEWLIFQSLLAGFNLPRPELAAVMPITVGMLALTSGLAAACFVKAFGISFLAIPRSPQAENAQESPFSMLAGMGLLAAGCVVLGLAPVLVVPWLGKVVAGLGPLPTEVPSLTFQWSLQTPEAFGQISPLLAAGGLILICALIPLGSWLFGVNRRLRLGETWGCGRTGQTPKMEYTATAFAEPLRRIFAELYRPSKELAIDFHPDSKYFVESIEYKSKITPLFDRWLYQPLLRLVQMISRQVQRLQAGSVHIYLVYIAVILVALLLAARWL